MSMGTIRGIIRNIIRGTIITTKNIVIAMGTTIITIIMGIRESNSSTNRTTSIDSLPPIGAT